MSDICTIVDIYDVGVNKIAYLSPVKASDVPEQGLENRTISYRVVDKIRNASPEISEAFRGPPDLVDKLIDGILKEFEVDCTHLEQLDQNVYAIKYSARIHNEMVLMELRDLTQ